MTEREPLLRVEHLTKLFPIKKRRLIEPKRYVHAVEDVSFEVYTGETLGIVGESGSGKSTLARAVLALTPVTAGKVFYEGKEITDLKAGAGEKRRLRGELQMIFQDPYASLNPKIKIGEAIAEPMLLSGQAANRKEAGEKVKHLLETVGLRPEVYDRFPHEFSGGQRQRIGIVRALAVNPRLLFCDESVSALDVSVQAQILNLFNELKEKFHLTYVFIGHDLAVVRYISDRILVMYLGKVMEIAPYDALFGENTHPYTQALVSAVPEPSTAPRAQRIILEGDIPSVVEPPKGCRFCQRCFKAETKCFEEEPGMTKVGEGHFIRCHFAKEVQ
ncbi:oligopeptide transporter subunit; ATP-binding component of ABC superfamily [uncultured Eubacteriales bacterium]|uniref:Oligopeptide transporter subunit ATP-binding component of ABC superfamily n=1 Tax=uncultured Eubacteriales bacterium TaxID=172733 RepID=A0A212KGU1_9FIRM|nr:oligopeptide transporter subunit; ATP-binding component of ABC superfamily [uncultured Eubacteriales bacterium]